jgi:hypothetical protein
MILSEQNPDPTFEVIPDLEPTEKTSPSKQILIMLQQEFCKFSTFI